MPNQPRKLSGLIFSREIRPETNREKFDILGSRNMLSTGQLQTTSESSIYKSS
jgi:hypothetical protein